MSMEDDKMIAALRDRKASWIGAGMEGDKLCLDAAARIEVLSAELAALREENAEMEAIIRDTLYQMGGETDAVRKRFADVRSRMRATLLSAMAKEDGQLLGNGSERNTAVTVTISPQHTIG